MRLAVFVLTLLVPLSAHAETFTLGPSDDFTILEDAGPGDIVEIEPGTYGFRVHLTATGTADMPIIIRAADPSNRPVWDLSDSFVEDAPGSYTGGDRGRGCWQVRGEHYQIEGIVFRECHTAGGNSAGIRYQDSSDLTVTNSLFEDNDVGFSGNGERTVVEHCEFARNGRVSSPPQHSSYIFGGSFTLRYSYIHDSVGGQNFHIRAANSVIEYNWFARAANYEGDIMTGDAPDHTMLFRGNVVVGNPSPGNGSHVIVLFNDAGDPGISMTIRLLYNTFVVQSGSDPALVSIRNDTLESAAVEMSNNVVVGTGQAVRIREAGTSNVMVAGTNNWFETGADVTGLSNTVFGDDPGFADRAGLDFRPAAGSPLVGGADSSIADVPSLEYFENETLARRYRVRETAEDIGALESTTDGESFGPGEPAPPMQDAGMPVDAGNTEDGGGDDAGPGSDAGAGSDGAVDAGSSGGGGGCSVASDNQQFALLALGLLLVSRRKKFL